MTGLDSFDAPASATIATIAGEVGVSVATVSKVLNGRSDVAPGTRARVEESLERHQYRRRNRRQPTSTGQIELVFHEFDVVWAMQILRGVEAMTTSAGLGLTVSQLEGAHRPSPRFLESLLARRPLAG